MNKKSVMTIMVLFVITLSGCAAMTTAIEHRNLDISSRMSDTIFLDPVLPDNMKVLLQVKNTSDKDLHLEDVISQRLTAKGYSVTKRIDEAHYLLQVNVLYAGKAKPQDIRSILANGYGGSLGILGGGVLGAAAGGSMHNNARGYMVGGALGALAGGMTETIANAMVKDVTYSVVTDIQLSEKSDVAVDQQVDSNLSQGSQTQIKQVVKTKNYFKRYRTRVASTANKVNLKFEDALPELEASIGKTIAGIL